MSPADDLLKKLRRLPANMVCCNCDSDAQRGIGFSNICVAFRTFVCDYCKTSHQAISHRVKSVSMSEWTLDEVRELSAERGGGNDAARNTWLANAPAIGSRYPGGSRPKKGDKIEIFKQFILDCYEHGKFKGDAGGSKNLTAGAGSSSGPWGPASTAAHGAPATPAAAAAPAFDLFAESAPTTAPTSAAHSSSAFGDFDAFTGNPQPATQAHTGLNNPVPHVFGDISMLASPRTMASKGAGAAVDPFSSLGTTSSATTNGGYGHNGTLMNQSTGNGSFGSGRSMGGMNGMGGNANPMGGMGGMNGMGGNANPMGAMGGMNSMGGNANPMGGMGGMGLTAPQGTMSMNGPNSRQGAASSESSISTSRTNVSTAFAFDPTQMSSLGPAPTAQSSSAPKKSQDAFASLSFM
eukprot:GSChrysophyteH1.ASY1.ANO1.679.1 assembled CDS